MVDHMDSINGYHTHKERQLVAVPELQNSDHLTSIAAHPLFRKTKCFNVLNISVPIKYFSIFFVISVIVTTCNEPHERCVHVKPV